MNTTPVSLFRRANRPDDVSDVIIPNVLDDIRSGRWADPVAAVRAAETKDERRALKLRRLPAVAFSGSFTRRENVALTQHSGLVHLDFDDVDDPRGLRDEMGRHRHVWAAFLSVSGTGVKALVPVEVVDPETGECRAPADDAEHKAAWAVAARLFTAEGGRALASLDAGCKDVARLCYVSHDPELRVNDAAEPVTCTLAAPEAAPAERRQREPRQAPRPSSDRDDVALRLEEIWGLLDELPRPAPSGDYDYWLSVYANLLAFAEENGHSADDARGLMERWSPARARTDYPDDDRGLDRGQAGAFVNLLKDVGLDYVAWLRERRRRRGNSGVQGRDRVQSGREAPYAGLDAVPGPIGVLVADVEREAVAWLWPGRLALGKLTIIDGDPGLGKSTLYCDLAASVTTGRTWPDGAPVEHTGGVVVVTTEDGIGDTIRPRLEEADADVHRVSVVQLIPEAEGPGRVPVLPDDVELLMAECRRMGARLLIIDPLMAYLGDANSYKDQDVRRALAPLSGAAERTGVAVAVVRHLNKATGGSALYRGGGSIGIIGAARVGLFVGRDPDDENRVVLACAKNNVARRPPSLAFRLAPSERDPGVAVVRWEGEVSLTAEDLCRPAKAETPRDDAADWLAAFLASGPRLSEDVFNEGREAGHSKKTLYRAKGELGIKPKKQGFDGGWEWALPEGAEQPNLSKMAIHGGGHLRGPSAGGDGAVGGFILPGPVPTRSASGAAPVDPWDAEPPL